MKAEEEFSFIVIDNSVAVTWVMDDERNPHSEQLLAEIRSGAMQPITLPLFWYEFRNMLISNVRRRRIGADKPPSLVREIRALQIEEREVPSDDVVLELGLRHGLTGYDASYLALAVEAGAILATNDKQLVQAGLREGLELRTMLNF